MKPRRLWISGPVGRLEEYAAAARAAGWEPALAPLIEIAPLDFDWPSPAPDWLCVASASALPALTRHAQTAPDRLAGLPFAAVGERTSAALAQLGAHALLPASEDAQALLSKLEREGLTPPQAGGHRSGQRASSATDPTPPPDAPLPSRSALGPRVLVPHGDRSSALAQTLFALGFEVLPRLAYQNRALHPAPPPATAWVLLASPSAVDALARLPAPPGGWLPIAIGPTTTRRILDLPLTSAAPPRSLPSPTPRGLTELLRKLG